MTPLCLVAFIVGLVIGRGQLRWRLTERQHRTRVAFESLIEDGRFTLHTSSGEPARAADLWAQLGEESQAGVTFLPPLGRTGWVLLGLGVALGAAVVLFAAAR